MPCVGGVRWREGTEKRRGSSSLGISGESEVGVGGEWWPDSLPILGSSCFRSLALHPPSSVLLLLAGPGSSASL